MWFQRGRSILSSLLPHPSEKSSSPLRPSVRKEGVYHFVREDDDSILVVEPGGRDSYELAFFETEIFVARVLRLSEVERNGLLDRLWSFRHVSIDLETGLIQAPFKGQRTLDEDGMEVVIDAGP
jgi:hypothetical protein